MTEESSNKSESHQKQGTKVLDRNRLGDDLGSITRWGWKVKPHDENLGFFLDLKSILNEANANFEANHHLTH